MALVPFAMLAAPETGAANGDGKLTAPVLGSGFGEPWEALPTRRFARRTV